MTQKQFLNQFSVFNQSKQSRSSFQNQDQKTAPLEKSRTSKAGTDKVVTTADDYTIYRFIEIKN